MLHQKNSIQIMSYHITNNKIYISYIIYMVSISIIGNIENLSPDDFNVIYDNYTVCCPIQEFDFNYKNDSDIVISGTVASNGSVTLNNNSNNLKNSLSQNKLNWTFETLPQNITGFSISLLYTVNNNSKIDVTFSVNSTYCTNPNPNAPCFSYQTLKKILKNIENDRNFILVHEPRNNKKMYRCNIKNFGEVEFTYDHGFLYNNKIYSFEELLTCYSNIENIEEISMNECEIVYNIIGHTKQISKENLFKINDELFMFGGTFNFEITQEYFEKKINIIKNLQKNISIKEHVENKYFYKI